MHRRLVTSLPVYVGLFLMSLALGIPSAWAQHGSEGTVTVTVIDPAGSLVQGADLELHDLATNDIRKAKTQDNGTYTFVNLALGKYTLRVTKSGFRTQQFPEVVVQAAQTTDIKAALKVGAVNETIEVAGGTAPLVETTTNAIGTTVDLRQIEDLPIVGRDLTQLSQLVPGAGFVNGAGTYDGLPAIAQGNNIDGVISSTSRMKFGGNSEPNVEPRVEDIEEMTVQTEQLNLDQGFGQANMQLNFVTRRGSNAFHGRFYDDFRNSGLDANSWVNDTQTAIDPSNPARKNLLILNEFGASVGGPIIKDKLFFFGTYAESKQPGAYTTQNYLFTGAAQSGSFTYDVGNAPQTVNLFTLAQNYNTTHPTANLPTAPPTCPAAAAPFCTAAVLGTINPAVSNGQISPNGAGDPNLNQLTWQVNNPTTRYLPTVRVDYIASQKMRFNLAWNMTKENFPGALPPDFPGSAFAKTGAGTSDKNYTIGFGFDWTLSPTLVNEFRGGFLYDNVLNAYNAPPLNINAPQLGWNYPSTANLNGGAFNSQMSGTIFYTGIQTYYPVFNASDTMSWQHGAHTINYGFSWWREQDHYYNPAQGFPVANFGLAAGDQAQNAFSITGPTVTLPGATQSQQSQAQQLYAILTDRLASVGGSYPFVPSTNNYQHVVGRYNLDELTGGKGLFFQDSYRVRRNLTLNYGLRWDFTSTDKDLSNLYHSASLTSIWGPSGVGNLFNPGSFTSNPDGLNPALSQISKPYNSWNIAPQPAFGIAWNPSRDSGFLGKLLGGDKTVIRAGYSLRDVTEPQQYVWNQASDYGSFYYQSFFLNANSSGAPGTFLPGTLSVGNFNPNSGDPTQAFTGHTYGLKPQVFLKSEQVSDFTFQGGPGLNGIEPHIQQPYTQSWNVGIQRGLGQSGALEVRYVGSRTLRQWVPIPTDEINIFENGFLAQFKAAQQNLTINNASGNANFAGNFANHNLPGQQALPVFETAFQGGQEFTGPNGSTACADGNAADFCAGNFVTDLQFGTAGSMASALAGIGSNADYFCNLVGQSFVPCFNIGYRGAGAGYPINYFQTNPYAQGTGFGYPSITEAEAYSNYNSLQIDFRQRAWHGLQFDANYAWSHTLGIGSQNNWQGQGALFTIRDMRLSYGPALFDLHNVIHINGTYDLPFGKGKLFANQGGIIDRVVGGWTVGTIFTFQTGAPFLLLGGNNTFNDYADGGVTLTGVTASQLQSAIGTYRIPGSTNVAFINPKYLAGPGGGGANSAFINPNTNPGTFGQRVWLYGPHNTFDDVAITKKFPITEKLRFTVQAEMLNAFNHPTFGPGVTNGGTNFGFNTLGGFGISTGTLGTANFPLNSPNGGARIVELRGNIEF